MPQPFQTFSAIAVLLPGLGDRWRCGGLLIAQKCAELLGQHIQTQVVTYIDREPDVPFLDQMLASPDRSQLFIATWAPHINQLIERLGGRRLVYYAQSLMWSDAIRLPATVPVLTLSRFIMAQWALRAPHNPVFFLPPVLEADCRHTGQPRDIDVLFVERKATPYVRQHLIPALQQHCHVHIVREFIDRPALFELYNRSKVYVYASGGIEGFGFQPLEALVCGCTVFSTLNGGPADYLDPELCGFQLGTYSLQYDIERILNAVAHGQPPELAATPEVLRGQYSQAAFHVRVQRLLPALDGFFAHTQTTIADISDLSAIPMVPALRLMAYKARVRLAARVRSLRLGAARPVRNNDR